MKNPSQQLIKLLRKNYDHFIITELVEIKPKKETALTKKSSVYDQAAITLNHSKWKSAKEYCDKAGITFRILTETELFRK